MLLCRVCSPRIKAVYQTQPVTCVHWALPGGKVSGRGTPPLEGCTHLWMHRRRDDSEGTARRSKTFAIGLGVVS
jgi:hypothetical protein